MKISIITPAYNASAYLEDCYRSLISQTHRDFEWIIVNDGSTDSTAQVLEKLAQQDNRIIVLNQENQGSAVARNTGLSKRTGEFFAFVDADDLVHPDFLKLPLDTLLRDGSDLVSFAYARIADDVKYTDLDLLRNTDEKPCVYEDAWAHYMNKKQSIELTMWNKLYRTDVFKDVKFIDDCRQAQDILFGWHIRQKSKKISRLYNELYFYRQSETSITKKGITERFLNGINLFFINVYNDLVASGDLTNEQKEFVHTSLNNHIFKVYYRHIKLKKLKPELKEIAIKDIKHLKEKGIFTPSSLPFKRRMRTWF